MTRRLDGIVYRSRAGRPIARRSTHPSGYPTVSELIPTMLGETPQAEVSQQTGPRWQDHRQRQVTRSAPRRRS